MNSKELPEVYKYYFLVLSNGWEHQINGVTKKNILISKSQFVELEDGNCINRAFITQIKFDRESTMDHFNRLPQSEKDSFVNEIVKKE